MKTVPPERREKNAFPETQWSRLGALKDCTVETKNRLLNDLIARYCMLLFCYTRRQGASNEEARDLVQDFFSNCLLKELFQRAGPTRGRFRTFLLACLENHLNNAYRGAHAKRRRPEKGLVSLDDLLGQDDLVYDPPDHETPEAVFHRVWAAELVRRVLKELEKEFKNGGKRTHYELFRLRIMEPALEGGGTAPHGGIVRTVRTLGKRSMQSVAHGKTCVPAPFA